MRTLHKPERAHIQPGDGFSHIWKEKMKRKNLFRRIALKSASQAVFKVCNGFSEKIFSQVPEKIFKKFFRRCIFFLH